MCFDVIMYCKFSFIMSFFILFHLFLACETPNHINKEYIDVLNKIRMYQGWNQIKGLMIKHLKYGRMDSGALTKSQIREDNYTENYENFFLFLSCRYVWKRLGRFGKALLKAVKKKWSKKTKQILHFALWNFSVW